MKTHMFKLFGFIMLSALLQALVLNGDLLTTELPASTTTVHNHLCGATTVGQTLSPSAFAAVYGEASSRAFTIQETSDHGYIVGGYSWSGAGYEDILILKLNQEGEITWQRTYGAASWDQARAIRETSDGGYIIVGGTTNPGFSDWNVWILKITSNGHVSWQKTYRRAGAQDYAYSIDQTIDGGYIVAGGTSFADGSRAWILKLTANGEVTWQQLYGGGEFDNSTCEIRETTDGNYIVAGKTNSFGAGSWDAWVFKLNTNGEIIWANAYGGADWDEPASIFQTLDGGYLVAGKTRSYGAGTFDGWVLKLDSSGEIDWQKAIGGAESDSFYSVQETDEGGYILGGSTSSFGFGYSDGWILGLDGYGEVAWQKTYGGASAEGIRSIQKTYDSGYVAAGYSYSFSGGPERFWILRTDEYGNIPDCSVNGTSTPQAVTTEAMMESTSTLTASLSFFTSTPAISITTPSNNSDFLCGPTIIEPDMNVKAGWRIIPDGSTYNFDNVQIGSSKAVTFEIENLGNVPLKLTSDPTIQISGSSHFAVTEQPISSTLTPGESVPFEITFTAGATTTQTADVYIPNNDLDENPYTFGVIAQVGFKCYLPLIVRSFVTQ